MAGRRRPAAAPGRPQRRRLLRPAPSRRPHREEQLPRILRKLGDHGEPVAAAYAELPAIPQGDDYDWAARQAEERREREQRTFHQDPMINGNWKACEQMPRRIVVDLSAAEFATISERCRGRCITAPELVRLVALRLANGS